MTTAIRSDATRSVVVVNGVDVLAVNQDGSVSILANVAAPAGAQIMTAAQSFGVGQTLQNVTASRVLGTTYTNNTGRPITVTISNSSASTMTFNINGALFAQFGAASTTFACMTAIVPVGATYVATGGSASSWLELR